jgi:hypothetical protein
VNFVFGSNLLRFCEAFVAGCDRLVFERDRLVFDDIKRAVQLQKFIGNFTVM